MTAPAPKITKTSIRLKKINDLSDVESILQEVALKINEIESKLITPEDVTSSDKDAVPGMVKITKKEDKSHGFEIMTTEGWKTPFAKDVPVTFESQKTEFKKVVKKSIDEIEADDLETGNSIANLTSFDEKANKFILPRPDYDSGWFFFDWSASNIDDVPYSINHNLGVFPRVIKVYYAPSQGAGTIGDAVSEEDITHFQEMTNGLSATWAGDSYDRIGILWDLEKNRIRFSAGDSMSMTTMNATWGSAGYSQPGDGAIKVLMWK